MTVPWNDVNEILLTTVLEILLDKELCEKQDDLAPVALVLWLARQSFILRVHNFFEITERSWKLSSPPSSDIRRRDHCISLSIQKWGGETTAFPRLSRNEVALSLFSFQMKEKNTNLQHFGLQLFFCHAHRKGRSDRRLWTWTVQTSWVSQSCAYKKSCTYKTIHRNLPWSVILIIYKSDLCDL